MNKLFVYGLLQKNFVLGLEKYGCTFLGKDQVNGRLYLIGGQGVGLRLDEHPVPTDIRAKGEVWEIPDELWDWLNEIEGVDIGTYTLRKIRTLNGVECVIMSTLHGIRIPPGMG